MASARSWIRTAKAGERSVGVLSARISVTPRVRAAATTVFHLQHLLGPDESHPRTIDVSNLMFKSPSSISGGLQVLKQATSWLIGRIDLHRSLQRSNSLGNLSIADEGEPQIIVCLGAGLEPYDLRKMRDALLQCSLLCQQNSELAVCQGRGAVEP